MGTHQKLNLFSNMKLIAFVALAVFALVAISSLGFLGSEQGFVSRSLLAKNKDDPLYARPLAEDEIRYIKWQQRVKAIDYAKEVHELHDESSRKSHEHSYSSSDRSSWAGDREADKHARRVPIFKEAENRGEDLAEEFNKDLENLESDCESDDEDKEYCKRAIRCVGIHGITRHWDKFHMLSAPCQKIVNQFTGKSKSKKFYNPIDQDVLKEAEELAITFLGDLAIQRQEKRLACDHDFICNQKMDCYLTKGLSVEFADVGKIVRCPYGDFQHTTTDENEDDTTELKTEANKIK